ncbi:hypothetical protein AB0A70_20860 [Streptomyces morookaense]|uniref:hypothetical protein n=1 Tax=Streptomyces morookaense TaxID=1970 RepID=UPI0033FC614A
MDFNIDADEQRVLFTVVGHLDAGSNPTVGELSEGAGRDVESRVESLHRKGWLLVRDVDGCPTVMGLSPMAIAAVRNLRFGRRGGPT